MINKRISYLLRNRCLNEFVGGASAAFIIIVVGRGLSYLVQLVLARQLGVDGYGIYIYVLTIVAMLSLFSTMGFDSSLLKYLALYRSQKQWAFFWGILKRSVQITFILSILVALIVIVAVNSIDRIVGNHDLYNTLVIGCIFLPFFTLMKVLQSVYRSQKKIAWALFPSDIAVPFLLISVIGFFTLFPVMNLTSTSMLAIHVIIIAFILFLFSYLLIKQLSGVFELTLPPAYKMGEWSRVSCSLLLISGMHIVLAQTDIMLLGFLKGTADAGVYSIAVKISYLVAFGLEISNQIIAPMISEYYHADDKEKLQELVGLGALVSTVVAVVVSFGIGFFAYPLLNMFGKGFVDGVLPLYILIIGQLVNALMGPVGFIMTMTKHHREASIIISVSAVMNILLNCILIPLYGMLGAAIATTLTILSWNIAFWYYVRKKVGINTLITSFFSK